MAGSLGAGSWGLGAGGGGGVAEAGEGVVGAVGGDEALAVGEDGGMALVGGLIVVLFEPPKEGVGVGEELVVEGVLGGRWGEVGPLMQGTVVVALPGEFFKFFVGEAVCGADELWFF